MHYWYDDSIRLCYFLHPSAGIIKYFSVIEQKQALYAYAQLLFEQLNKQMEKPICQQKHTKYTVSVRIKPNLSNDPVCIYSHKSKYIKESRPKSILTYCFDNVFEDIDNAGIYESSLKKTVHFFLNNRINTTILAYGQTGSGKTFTLFGSKAKQEKGLVDFMVEEIVNYSTSKGVKLKCSFMQIYKEKVTDLMTSEPVQLRQSSTDLVAQNLKVFQIKEKEELVSLLKQAHSNKIFGNSYLNSQSSRSHVVFTIECQKRKFNVVDLCGSEVLTYKFNEQQREETNSINLSLFTLNAVVSDLALKENGKNKFIPFRNSVLTRILKQSLLDVQKSQIYLFCNVSPELKHQSFTASTLRFGQLAIQIDEANNVEEEKVNLSQQKRDKKMVSNIVDIKPQLNKGPATYNINWTTKRAKIFDNQIKVYELIKQSPTCHVVMLHAYGNGCDGADWNLFVSYLSQNITASFYSVDFPGFGKSQGKKFTSRSQKFSEKEQSIDFMTKLFEIMGLNSKKKVILVGYDLGGAIALSCSFHPKLMKIVKGCIVLHPTWTDSIEKLAMISVPTLLLWFPLQNFHLVSAGQKMAKVIKSSRMYRLNISPTDYEKVGGYYDGYAEVMANLMGQFIKQNFGGSAEEAEKTDKMRGKIIQQNIEVNMSEEEEKLIKARESIQQIFKIISQGNIKEMYQTLLKGGPNKPQYARLVGQLPNFDPLNFSWAFLKKYGLITQFPLNLEVQETPFMVRGQQVQITTTINLNCLLGKEKYLAFDSKGEVGITHKARVCEEQSEDQIIEKEEVLVEVRDVNQQARIIGVPLANILYLNSPTIFKKNSLGHLLFEDSVTCNYNSAFLKLKLIEICSSLQPIIGKMDFKSGDILLDQQKLCAKKIYQLIDLKHLVHEGIDNSRYTGTDVGKLAYYGQGNCHHLASVTAALLYPFSKLLAWDIIFRAGSFFKTGREIDEEGVPLKDWNGKPKVNVEDHTWLQIRYRPSNKTFVFDPSFAICSQDLDQVYSFEGRMHISGKKLNFALDYELPTQII